MKKVHNKNVVYAMIPARHGSIRLQMKNLALINGQPMISYAIKAAKESGVFDKVIVNSEHEIFERIADRYSVEFYKRPDHLGSSKAKSDVVVVDFMHKYKEADIVVWVNPTSPLQTADEVHDVVEYFINEDLDSLITVENKQVHALFDGVPVNYNIHEKFAQTQDLKPVQPFVYSIMMWRTSTFLDEYQKDGHALFCGKFGTYVVNKMTGLIIKTKEDLMIIDGILRNRELFSSEIEYDQLVYDK